MRAALMDKPLSVIFTDVEEPNITKDNEVKIRVKYTGICGSEIHAYHGTHPFRIPPLVSGHEFSGVIVETGKDVKNFKVGDRVTAEPQVSCGQCAYCQNGLYHLCDHKKVLGAKGWIGSFGEYIVMPEQTLILLPDSISFEYGAVFEPLAVGVHAVRMSNAGLGAKIVVVGCGPIGLAIVLAAKLAGCAEIIVSDAVDYNLGVAAKMGATCCINARKENIIKKINEMTNGIGVDYTFLAFGNGPIVTDAIEYTRKRGTIMEVAVLGSPKEVDFSNFYQKELNLCGSSVYVKQDFEIVKDAMLSGKFDLSEYVSGIMPIEEAGRAFEIVDKKLENTVKMLMKF